MTNNRLPWIDEDAVFSRLGFGGAVRAIQRSLIDFDPAGDPSRQILDLSHGQLLLMPSESGDHAGVKIASIAPGNPALGKERIQGIYLLLDAVTLSPICLLDGAALTTLRTPAVSAAVAEWLAPARADHLVVFGSGPQAWGHIQALGAIRELHRVTVVGRNEQKAQALVARARGLGLDARTGFSSAVADAQLVVCATTASDALFDSSLLPDDSCVVAVGSHEAEVRELDGPLMGRAQVVVEDRATALRGAGDVVLAIEEGYLDADAVVPMRDIVTGVVAVDGLRPRVFKSVGMSWQDLVIAAAVHAAPDM